MDDLRTLFPDDGDLVEKRQFSRLHSIVLGLVSGSLEEELAEPSVNVNATDIRGRTALSWAVARKDHAATRLLLQHKADPNIASLSGDAPAAFASYWNNVTGLRLLLEAGASISQRNSSGISFLYNACQGRTSAHGDFGETIEVLIAAGCDVHAKNDYGHTALNIAAQNGSTATLCTLMSHGSDIHTTDVDGDFPLMNALYGCKDENTRLLLERGTDYTRINNYSQTTLHFAALYGSPTTLEILRSANLSRIEPNAKDKKGKTALELAQERLSKPDGFINLFLTLLFEIRCRNDAIARNEGLSQGTESVDPGVSEPREAGGSKNSAGGSSQTDSADTSIGSGAAELGNDDDANGAEAFFDALEQQ